MSKVYPTKSIGSSPGFEVGDPVKFHMFLEKLYEVFLQFGRKGRDLIPHLKAHPPHVIPTADDMMIVTLNKVIQPICILIIVQLLWVVFMH